MRNTPPSVEAGQDLAEAVERVLGRPGETVQGFAVFLLVEDPEGRRRARLVLSPAEPRDRRDAVLRILSNRLRSLLEED